MTNILSFLSPFTLSLSRLSPPSLSLYQQEDCRVKCHRYFPADNREDGRPDYVQFEQVSYVHVHVVL